MDDQDRRLAEALQTELGAMRAPEDLKAHTLAAMKAARDEATRAKVVTLPVSQSKRRQRRRMSGRLVAALVACCCLLFVGGGGTYVYATPTAYVDLSAGGAVGNTSGEASQTGTAFIELVLNRFNRVVGATAANDQAQAILDACAIKHKDYADAVNELLAQAEAQGIIIEGDIVGISVACDNGSQSAGLAEASDACVSAAGCQGSASQTSVAEHRRARDGSGVGSDNSSGAGNGSGAGNNNGSGSNSSSGGGAGAGSGAGSTNGHGQGDGFGNGRHSG